MGRKLPLLDALDADVTVVPECSRSSLPAERSIWVGAKPNKGLGVVTRSEPLRIADCHHDGLRWFVPVEFERLPFRLLAVWAFNHRDGLERRSRLAVASPSTAIATSSPSSSAM